MLYAVLRLSWLAAEWSRRGATARARAGLAIASVGALALAFGLLSLHDSKSPSIVALASPMTPVASNLAEYDDVVVSGDQPAATIRAACDEPCSIENAWLLGEDGHQQESVWLRRVNADTSPRRFWTTVLAGFGERRGRGALATTRSARDTDTVEIHLTQEQARTVKESDGPQVKLDVRDDAGHRIHPVISWNYHY